jgi:hypothetical protein
LLSSGLGFLAITVHYFPAKKGEGGIFRKAIWWLLTHSGALAVGFAAGIYALPILIAPPSPENAALDSVAASAQYRGEFRRDLKGSDALHWGEGKVFIDRKAIAMQGRLAPGPDYRLYLSPEFVETEADFLRIKSQMQRVGDVKTFENFLVTLPADVDPSRYRAVIVWYETFGQFITAARYR